MEILRDNREGWDTYVVSLHGATEFSWKLLPADVTGRIFEFYCGDNRAWILQPRIVRTTRLLWADLVPYESLRSRWQMVPWTNANQQIKALADFDRAREISADTGMTFRRAYFAIQAFNPGYYLDVPSSFFWPYERMMQAVAGAPGDRIEYMRRLEEAIYEKKLFLKSLKVCLLIRAIAEVPGTAAHSTEEEMERELLRIVLDFTIRPIAVLLQALLDASMKVKRFVDFIVSHVDMSHVAVVALIVAFWFGVYVLITKILMPAIQVLVRFVFRQSFTLKTVDIDQAPLEPKAPALNVKLVTPSVQIEEMAMPGSALCASIRRPVGAIMVANENTELMAVGCFFRYKDWLVTAKHVANQVSSGLADVYLVPPEVTSRGSTKLNLKQVVHVEKSRFELDENLFTNQSLDVFVMKLTAKEWTRLNLNAVHLKKATRYKQTVSSAGYVNGVLQSGSGTTSRVKHTHFLLAHTASTLPGFSGSPIFSGSSVVGVHISGSKSENWLVRMEVVIHYLPRDEISTDLWAQEYLQSYKDRDEDLEVYDEDDEHLGVSRSGRLKFLDEEELAKRGFDLTDKVRRSDVDTGYSFNFKKGARWADVEDDDDDAYGYHYRKHRGESLQRNESIIISPDASTLPLPTQPKKPIRVEDRAPVHGSKMPSDNPDVVNYFQQNMDTLKQLGFKQGEYVWPDTSPAHEEVSLIKHLEMFANDQPEAAHIPTAEERERCVNVCLDLLRANRFEPKTGYKSEANLSEIINSNLIGARKSAGRPYQAEGMPTNGDVLKNIGVQGLINLTYERWNEEIDLKLFPKSEPNKKKKVEAKMIRVVTGFPVHKTVKNQAIFRESLNTAVENWKESPIKYAFNPGLPGHIEHLASCFRDCEVEEADKSNWDFHMYEYLFDICKEVHIRLAVQPADMSDEEFETWKTDAAGAYDEVYKSINYVCTNGRAYTSPYNGIMKSGWLCTIFTNSLAQVVLHVLTMMRCKQTDEAIKSPENYLVAGGDDTMNRFKTKKLKKSYVEESLKLGFPFEFKNNKKFAGSEFFSNHFKEFRGMWGFEPVRFTKHVEKFGKIKNENLAPALSCAMINYCWKNAEFKFFQRMYAHFRKADPENFPLHFLIDQRAQQYKCKGLESVTAKATGEYVNLDSVLDSLISQ